MASTVDSPSTQVSPPPATFELAQQLQLSGQLEDAAQCYLELISFQPDQVRPYCYFKLAGIRQQQGQVDLAVSIYLTVIGLNPNYEAAYQRLWWLDAQPPQLEKAVQACLETANAGQCEILPLVYATLGNLLTRLGRLAAAIDAFQQSAEALVTRDYPILAKRHWAQSKSHGPDFLVIGGMKCGTTSIYQYLVQHPCILPAIEKEIQFFSLYSHAGIDWYRAQFPRIPSGHLLLTGEASPYLGTAGVPESVFEHFPKAKLVVLLR
ncbi:MAG: hypothetical protein AAF329_15145, partial [Cyanobacteria bacterium P01_A01_bin.17]